MALSQLLRAKGRTLTAADAAQLDNTLDSRWHAARARWPQVKLSLDGYGEHVASLLGDSALEDLHCEDLYLAAAATRADPEALSAFDREFLSGIGKHLGRIDASPAFTDEVRQIVRERSLVGPPPRIAGYSGQGPLGGWVRMVALRVALNLRRGQVEPRPLDEVLELAAGNHSPELALIVARSREAVAAAVQAAFSRLSSEDRALLRLYLMDELSIDALAELYQIHRSTAARRIANCRQRVVEETLAQLTGKLRLSPSDLESLLGLVRSRLELNLDELLATLS